MHNIARCLAELTFAWAGEKGLPAIEPVISQMLNDSEYSELDSVKQFALLTLGELGRRIPLGPKVTKHQIAQFKVQ